MNRDIGQHDLAIALEEGPIGGDLLAGHGVEHVLRTLRDAGRGESNWSLNFRFERLAGD